MADEINKITIIGCGPGNKDYLTPLAQKTALSRDILAGASRLFTLFPEFSGKKIFYRGTADLIKKISNIAEKSIGILVSGDVTYFSLAERIVKHFGIENCTLIPGISSIQVALSHFGLMQNTTRIISAHAGIPKIPVESLTTEKTILLLGGNPASTEWIISLAKQTTQTHKLNICIDLTLKSEQILTLQNPVNESLLPYLKHSRIILIFHQYN